MIRIITLWSNFTATLFSRTASLSPVPGFYVPLNPSHWERKKLVWLWKGRIKTVEEKGGEHEIIEVGSRQRKQRRMAKHTESECEREEGRSKKRQEKNHWLSSSFTLSHLITIALHPSTHHHSISDVKEEKKEYRRDEISEKKNSALSYQNAPSVGPFFLLLHSIRPSRVEMKHTAVEVKNRECQMIRETVVERKKGLVKNYERSSRCTCNFTKPSSFQRRFFSPVNRERGAFIIDESWGGSNWARGPRALIIF